MQRLCRWFAEMPYVCRGEYEVLGLDMAFAPEPVRTATRYPEALCLKRAVSL